MGKDIRLYNSPFSSALWVWTLAMPWSIIGGGPIARGFDGMKKTSINRMGQLMNYKFGNIFLKQWHNSWISRMRTMRHQRQVRLQLQQRSMTIDRLPLPRFHCPTKSMEIIQKSTLTWVEFVWTNQLLFSERWS